MTMHERLNELISQAQEKIDNGNHDVRSDLNVTDWYISTALKEMANRIDRIETLLAQDTGE